MNRMTYKGYSAKINFDERDGLFWGKVMGIKESITFQGDTVAQLTEDFHKAIDHYLADCANQGRTPDKPFSGKLTLRISPEIHAQIAAAAARSGKSLNRWVSEALKDITHWPDS